MEPEKSEYAFVEKSESNKADQSSNNHEGNFTGEGKAGEVTMVDETTSESCQTDKHEKRIEAQEE